ncbi:MAG: hypothetical protein RLZZ573_156, partial [Pseudomonadota bacterium]
MSAIAAKSRSAKFAHRKRVNQLATVLSLM